MEDPGRLFECEECGAEYSIHTDMDIADNLIVPEFCPFCGEPIEMLDWENDDENAEQES